MNVLAKHPSEGQQEAKRSFRGFVSKHWPLAIVIAVTAGVRLWNLGWGLPFIYHFDEPNNLAITLGMFESGDLNPHFFNYGSLLFYVGAVVIGVISVGMRITGWTGELSVDTLVMNAQASGWTSDPWMFITARLVSVGACVLAAAIVYRLVARLTRNRSAGVFAGLLFGLATIGVWEGRLFTPNALTGMFAAAVLHFSIRIYEHGERRDYLWAGAMVGLATGTKYNAALVGIGIVAAHVLRKRDTGAVYDRGLLVAIYTSLAFFVLATPFALFDPSAFFADLGFELTHYSNGHIAQSDGLAEYFPPLLVAFSFGLLLIPFGFIDRTTRSPAVIATAMAFGYLGFLLLFTTAFERNLLPALPTFAVACGLGAGALWRSTEGKRGFRMLGLLACGAALAISAVATYRAETTVEDRTEAMDWIAETVPPGSIVMVEWFSPWVDPQVFDVEGSGLFVLYPPEPGWDYMVMAGNGSIRVGAPEAEFPAGTASLESIRDATCLLEEFPEVAEIRVPSC